MSLEMEFLSPLDKPALLAISSPDLVVAARSALTEIGYKVHETSTSPEFLDRFGRIQYQVVIIEESFGGVLPEQNVALTTLQQMQMQLRRHAAIVLLGDLFETLHPMQAFQQSVHAVVNRMDAGKLSLILQQVINDNATFLNTYRDVQARLAQGKR